MPRRIVYVWDADYPWDVRTEKTCRTLTAAGHDVHIVARNKKWSPVVEQLPEGTVHRMPPWRWAGQRLDGAMSFPAFFSPRWHNLIEQTVRETQADLIIARDIPICPPAIRVGRKHGIPVILDMAENYPAMMRDIWDTGRNRPIDSIVRNPNAVARVEQWCVDRVDHIFVVVEESGERVERLGVPASKITVVSNTPSANRRQNTTRNASLNASLNAASHNEASVPSSDHTGNHPLDIVYLGIIEVMRGLVESIDAIAKLRDSGHKIRLRIIGSGRDEAYLRKYAELRGLGTEHVEFLGYIAYEEALTIVANSDVGLLPHRKGESWDTTIPNKLFDYMSFGLPVASSNTDPCARILAETGAGDVFRSGDAESLAALLEKLLNSTLRRQYGDAGTTAIRTRYNWEYDSEIMLACIKQIQTSVR